MKIYLATLDLQEMSGIVSLARTFHPVPPRLKILVSYHYYKQENIYEEFVQQFACVPEVFLDSGAFSAFTQGATIDLDAYAHYIQRHRSLFTVYANLDVIKNAEATWQNQRRLEENYGLFPLPVFHVGEPWSYLERYLERYSYIALGVASTNLHVYMPWLIQCFKLAKNIAVYHGFGITNWAAMKSFPWYSVDSTSWHRAGRYGQVWFFDEHHKRLQEVHINRLRHHRECYVWAKFFRKYGLDPAPLLVRHPDNIVKGDALSICALWQAEEQLERWYGNVSVPERKQVPISCTL